MRFIKSRVVLLFVLVAGFAASCPFAFSQSDVDLAIMDAVQAFTTGGPAKGALAQPNLMLASTDRVALDAAGVAIIRSHGTTQVTKGTIFEQEQIKRAAEIGVGATSPEDIELIPLNLGATEKAKEIREHLG